MKKLFLLLALLTVLSSHAQNNTYTKSSMVVLVTEAKKTFIKGTNYNDWEKIQIGIAVPTVQERDFLKDIYGFVTSNQNPEAVFKNYNGTSLLSLARTKDAINAFSESNKRSWFFWLIVQFVVANIEILFGGPMP